MKGFNYFLAILLAKSASFILKLFKSGASAAPGLYALKIKPDLLSELSQQLKESIIISGTNGKTTTARIIASLLKQSHIDYLHNRSGSNLERGVVSEIIKRTSWFHLKKKFVGLWEIDEAFLTSAIKKLQPKVIILLNLFRDQLDRYGEIDTLAKKWRQALKKLPSSSLLILNSDDPAISWLGKGLSCQVIYFGLRDKTLGDKVLSNAADAITCHYCSQQLQYQTSFVSQLGIYRCPQCGAIQPAVNIYCSQANFNQNGQTKLVINYKSCSYNLKINLIGTYNIYNLLAAFSAGAALKIKAKKIVEYSSNFQPAFGRLEKINLRSKTIRIILTKNPTGFNQALKTLILLNKKRGCSCLFSLNDLIADGRDVSWIWDIDFKYLNKLKIDNIIVSGTRAADMALRLKYANISQNLNIKLEKNIKKSLSSLINQSSKNLYILASYTAMLKIRKILAKKKVIHSIWDN